MGLHDRPYFREVGQGGFGGGFGGGSGGGFGRGGMMGGIGMGLPRATPVVKWLLIANAIVFVVKIFVERHWAVNRDFGVTVGAFWQVWRYITFQFLHGGFWHIVLNMLGVYFLGSALERSWGSKRFLRFYLICGVMAGVAYVLIGKLYGLPVDLPLIGASGGVYGILLACAVLFPQFRIIFLFFPVPIRLACLIIFGGIALTILSAVSAGSFNQAMSDVAHFGGAATAAVWIWVLPRLRGVPGAARQKVRQGAWDRKIRRRNEEAAEVDRVLQKIKDHGLGSLTRGEKQLLQDATRRQQEQDRKLGR